MSSLTTFVNSLTALEFISRLSIIGKDGKLITLTPTAEQIEIIETLEKDDDTIILKPRQIGSSTIVAAYLFYKAYTSTEPVTYAILSYKLSSSKHLLNIHKTFYNYLPKILQRELDVDNSTELSFVGGGRIIAVASTQKGGLRSFTASAIHISEYAFAENPEELKATAISALNDGQLIIESTANFFNDCLHKEILKKQSGGAHYNYLFFKWSDHHTYTIHNDDEIETTDEEDELSRVHDLSLAQLKWRREKISKLGHEKFVREFPLNLEEAYRISGSTYFTFDDFIDIEKLEVEPVGWTTFEDPDPNDSYAIGVDTSGGVGRDWSVIIVVSKLTHQIVCIWRDNRTSPIELSQYIEEAAISYNNALVLVEANNYGLATINELGHNGYGRLWKDPKNGKDFLTTSKSKPLLFENMKKFIQQGYIQILDNITLLELRSLTIDQKGIIKFADNIDSHSDNAMAFALALWCLNDVNVKPRAYLPEWIVSRKGDNIRQKAGAGVSNHRRY